MNPSPKPLSIAFQNLCKKDWIAGCNYLQNLFLALRSLPVPPKIFLLDMGRSQDDSYRSLEPLIDGIIKVAKQRPLWQRIHYRLQSQSKLALGSMNPVEYALRKQGVDMIFTGKSMGSDFKLPQMIWIADFQHLHLPDMFTEEDWKQRDKRYRLWIQEAQKIVLSSQNALEDLKTFAPSAVDKARVLNFVAHVPDTAYGLDPLEIANHYHLPKRFFYFPSQFWQHKNHRLVIEALALIKESAPDICVVCSGSIVDYRRPHYSSDLLNLIAEKGVHNQFRMLGMIPFAHIYPLIRQSIAVIQASLFEGWSTTVEETKSLGKSLILSDIPVHREQNPPASRFFNPKDPADLATCLLDAYQNYAEGPDNDLEAKSRSIFSQRSNIFAEQFLSIAAELVGESRN